jgi:hypothetical protein
VVVLMEHRPALVQKRNHVITPAIDRCNIGTKSGAAFT